jgi:hypothetical protein
MTDTPEMTDTTAEHRHDRDDKGRFTAGNPGRPKGAKHAALVALDAIGEEAAKDVLVRVIQDAKAGDMRAAEILLRRLWPERKGRLVPFNLPAMETPDDAVKAAAAIARAVAGGELTPEEGQAAAAVVEACRRTIETAQLMRRVDAIEERHRKEGKL